jgi:hypothetical protein
MVIQQPSLSRRNKIREAFYEKLNWEVKDKAMKTITVLAPQFDQYEPVTLYWDSELATQIIKRCLDHDDGESYWYEVRRYEGTKVRRYEGTKCDRLKGSDFLSQHWRLGRIARVIHDLFRFTQSTAIPLRSSQTVVNNNCIVVREAITPLNPWILSRLSR